MRVEEILRSKSNRLIKISPNASLKEASQLILGEQVGMLLIEDEMGWIMGTLSERDLICFLALKGVESIRDTVQSAMAELVLAASPNDSVSDVMRLMTEKRARHLPVFDGDSRDAQTVMAISGNLVPAGADRLDPVDLHQPSDTALADSEACLFEFHRHARTAIAAKAQAVLFPDMGQHRHIRARTLADRSCAP